MLIIRLNKINKTNKNDIVLKSTCGIAFSAPQVSIKTTTNKVGKTKSSSKIKFDSSIIKLGITANIPRGLQLVVIPNSNLYHKYGLLPVVSYQVYSGETPELSIPVIAFNDTAISSEAEVGKVVVRLSANASLWTKLQYLFNKVKIEINE